MIEEDKKGGKASGKASGCPHSSAKKAGELEIHRIQPSVPATPTRDSIVSEIYALNKIILGHFWENFEQRLQSGSPILLNDRDQWLSKEDFSKVKASESRTTYCSLLQNYCGNAVRKIMEDTCAQLLQDGNDAYHRLSMIYKRAPNFNNQRSLQEYLVSGGNNAVIVTISTFLTIANKLGEKRNADQSNLSFLQCATASKPFVFSLASSHLAVFSAMTRGIFADPSYGFRPSQFLELTPTGQLVLSQDFLKTLQANADTRQTENPALAHTKLTCPAMRAGKPGEGAVNIVGKLYDWMLDLAKERLDLFEPQK